MDATTHDQRDEGWEPYAAPHDEQPLPRRPRRQFLNKRGAALIAAVTCSLGFYAGVRIEKGRVSGSSTITLPTAAGTGRSGTAAARFAASGARAGGSGLAALFGGGGGAAGSGASFGTVSGVKGNTLYVTSATTGNVTKVKLSSATKITKSVVVKRASLHPGDAVVIRGVTNPGGTLVAASVSDSRANAGGGGFGGGSSSSSGSTGSGSSAVSSLFSSGGSGG
jgi:hypothetical protein